MTVTEHSPLNDDVTSGKGETDDEGSRIEDGTPNYLSADVVEHLSLTNVLRFDSRRA